MISGACNYTENNSTDYLSGLTSCPSQLTFGVQGIAAEPDGKILIAAGGSIYRFDPVNNELSAVPRLAVDSSLYGNVFDNVATDAAGNIYYENFRATNLGILR